MKIDLSNKSRVQMDSDLSALLGSSITAAGITQLPLNVLVPYLNQPFKPYSETKLAQLTEDIAANGVLSPIIVRPRDGGQYEILAGHNRCAASKRAGLSTVPAIIKDVDDDTAALVMVNTNLNQRDELSPSEKAFAYKLQLEVMRRRAGRPAKDNVSQRGTQKRSDQMLAEQMGESRNQIQRYIRLTNLIPELLQQVDDGDLSMIPAVALSYLSPEEQDTVLEVSADCERKISVFQSEALKKATGKLTPDSVRAILLPERNWNPQQDFATRSRALIPKTANQQDVERVLEIVEKYFKKEAG